MKRSSAAYPKEALAKGLSGTVVLEFDVDEKGAVANVTVKTGAGHGFDEAAKAAVAQFVFQPARHDGAPVPSHVTYAYKFVLKTAPAPAKKKRDETVRLKGGVYLRGTRAPVAGGKVIAVPKETPAKGEPTSYSSRIDDAGQFALKGLPPGRYHIVVNGPKADRFETDETLGKDQVVTVHYFIRPSQYTRYESTVHGDLNREEISRQTLTTEELVKMPGTMGDALRAIENLPGVARAPFNSGLLIIRGGKPTDSKVFLGASEVPQLYHFGGFTSIVPTEAIESLDFLPGNFSVRYGRAIAGVIDVELREGKRDRWHGSAETNLFDTGVMAEGPVGKGSLLLAARRSYIDAILQAVAPPGLAFTDAPVYYDYQGVFDYPVAGGKLKVMVLGSDDVLKLVFDQPADADPSITAFGTHIFFHKAQVRYTHAVGRWNLFAQVAGGYSGQEGALGNNLRYDVGIGQVDARIEGRYVWSKKLRFLVGTDDTYSHVALDLDVPPPPHEGQIPSPISATAIEHRHGIQNYGLIGLFVEARWQPTEKLVITPGLRFDWYSALHHPSFDPRLTASYQVARFTTLKAGVGLFSQSPQSTDFDPQFGNPALRPEQALHTTLSLEQGIAPGVMLTLTGFYKHLWDLSTPTNNFLSLSGQTTPERFASIGEGRIYGMEIMLRQAISKYLFGWVSYTLMKSERKDCDTCGWRLFDYDQTHVLIAAVHAYLPKGWELGARFRYITGLPYTPAYGGFYDADSDVYAPANGPVNTGRLADYHALDLRIDKTFLFKRWVLKLYLDITNVYDHSNEEVNQPAFDFSRRAAITGLPIIPSFG
ncbi:MAG: TonB-dependent receptor domain-containing protein, partial [Polyangia bacterium]